MNKNLILKIRTYATRRELEIGERLGSGKDGTVFVAERKIASAKIAIKAHRFEENYLREKLAYERLRSLQISSVATFNIPFMLDFDDELAVLEMTIVERPFVLDFAASINVPNSSPKSGQSGKLKSVSNSKIDGGRISIFGGVACVRKEEMPSTITPKSFQAH